MPPRFPDRDEPGQASRGVIGPADPAALARAAEILRDRTMSFEAEEPHRFRPIVLTLIALTIGVAALVVMFRHHVKWFFGLF